MIPLAALKERAKRNSFEKLIGAMRGMEAQEHDPLSEHQNEEDKILDQMHDIIEPEDDHKESPNPHELNPEEADEESDFNKQKSAFMQRSNKNPSVSGKTRMLMLAAESKPKGMPFKKKGY